MKNRTMIANRIVKAVAIILLAVTAAMGVVGCTSENNSQNDSSNQVQNQAAQMSVTIDILAEGVQDFESQTVTVSVPEGATVHDALMASGFDVVVEDGPYGAFVASINDVENGALGSSSGWVFTVNDETIMESASSYKLVDGDKVQWNFVVM